MLGQGGIGQPNLAAIPRGAPPPAPPFVQTDWPLAKRAPRSPIDLSQSLNPNLFTNPIPFAQLDWSKPQQIKVTQPQPLGYNHALYSVVAMPFNQTDWSVPRRSMAPLPLAVAPNINLISALPFNQTDWAKPFYPRRAISPPDTININLFTNPLPFSQFDWSKPYRVRQARFSPDQALNINLFTNPMPFSQADPARPSRTRSLPDISQPFNPNLYGVVTVTMPFAQFDYPSARRPLANQARDIQNFILISVAPGAPPAVHDKPFFAMVGRLMNIP